MKKFATLLAVLAMVGMASADNYGVLGYSEDTVMQSDMGDQCTGIPIYNHDYSCENGYCWQFGGIVPPYYGCWAEAYDVGPTNVECGLYWLTQIGYYMGRPMDCYVWDGGVYGPPSGVLCVVPGITGLNIGFWPDCTLNEVEINCCVTADFTIGYWADFSNEVCQWYCCADENGFGGYPWTCYAPGIGYPTGWGPPNYAFPSCISMCIGATINDDPSPAEAQTWGSIKALFE
jgi:hypothetical protein